MAKKDNLAGPVSIVKADQLCSGATTATKCDDQSSRVAKIDPDVACKWGTFTDLDEKNRNRIGAGFTKTFPGSKGLVKSTQKAIDDIGNAMGKRCWTIMRQFK